MEKHFFDLSIFLIVYIVQFLAFYGWGNILASLFRIKTNTNVGDICRTIWLGWILALFLLQCIHLWFAISATVSLVLYGIGIMLSLPHCIYYLRQHLRHILTKRFIISGVLVILFVCWVASHAMLAPRHYDTGLYHLNTIRWANSYCIIPGLGNLHERLAFNQSFFLYVASLNFFPYLNYGRSLANSFLFFLLLWEFSWHTISLIRHWQEIKNIHPFLYIPYSLSLPLLCYLCAKSDGLASPIPDLTCELIQIYLFILFAQTVYTASQQSKQQTLSPYNSSHLSQPTAQIAMQHSDIPPQQENDVLNLKLQQEDRIIFIILLVVTSITIKLSTIVFSGLIAGFCLVFWLYYAGNKFALLVNKITILLIVVVAILGIWIVRSYILSGYPLYPATIGKISVQWAMPLEDVQNTNNWICSWARQQGVHWQQVLGNWNWLGPWFQTTIRKFSGFTCPVSFGIIGLLWSLFFYIKQKKLPTYYHCILICPIIASIIFWFFSAPDPRFARGVLWLFCLCSALILIDISQYLLKITKKFAFLVCLAVGIIAILALPYTLQFFSSQYISFCGYQPIPTVPLVQKTTISGLVIYVPEQANIDDPVWDSPIPATPNFNPNVRLITPSKLEDGFMLQNE